ncbi:alpha-hydroxy acid oxidase [Maritimibacter sp. DP1N21-5]|uniref:alpha-hydroxy acid oxidase n=1 Tax=Maritimibacter sp. DP1N21-5 TaxID=2836867 RepID=UPI001C48549D|nr:alpha-hydroxy acid oxidase [Maritimibacter sp. DP1N21-5]MBV7410857.1 alpha-hydroxy-acid oxidizing protein [Maritimibacter sp. DP1N21-5]
MRLAQCHNFHDFRQLAKRRLPGPIFNYIDGGADDEVTLRRNSAAFDTVDLVPHVLRGTPEVDLSVEVMGQKLALPFYLSPTALQRLFHHDGERAVAAAAGKYGTMFGVSSLGTVSLEELRRKHDNPQVYQFYFHKDRGLNRAMMQRAKDAGVNVMMLTVDSMTGGNRERDKRTGFSIPFKLTLGGMAQFAVKPAWGINYVTHEKFALPQLDEHVDMGGGTMSIGRYFTEMLDPTMNWDDLAEMVSDWGGKFCLKGVIHPDDAARAAEAGCDAVILSNHGGRQLDGSIAPFEALEGIVDQVGDRLEVIMDSGIQRGTHIVKALAMGAKAVGIGRGYLFPLAAAGQAGVERMVGLLKDEVERDMRLMGVSKVADLSRDMLRKR